MLCYVVLPAAGVAQKEDLTKDLSKTFTHVRVVKDPEHIVRFAVPDDKYPDFNKAAADAGSRFKLELQWGEGEPPTGE